MEQNYEQKLKNLKPIVFKDATDFIHDETHHIMNQLTKQHREIIQRFLSYRKYAEDMINERNFLHEQWCKYEAALALKSPVMEVEYA